MGGKGDDGGGSQNDQMAAFNAQQIQDQQAAANQKQKTVATVEPPKTASKEETPAPTEATMKQPEEVVPGSKNLTGLGDDLVGGLSAGRQQQIADQQSRLTSTPGTYGTKFDPYTGTYVGQGPYGSV